MRLDFWNKPRDKRIEFILKLNLATILVLVIFAIWTFEDFRQDMEIHRATWQKEEALFAYEFDRGCEILSEVYKCNSSAIKIIPLSSYGLFYHPGFQMNSTNIPTYLEVCQTYLRNPLATSEDCVKACWRCSNLAPGVSCKLDGDCQVLLGKNSKCLHFNANFGGCTYTD